MYQYLFIIYFYLAFYAKNVYSIVSYQPQQVHLAYGDNEFELVVTWSTIDKTKESIVEYGINGLILKATGYSVKFVDGGKLKNAQYIHRVVLTELSPNSKYVYHCGSNAGWSAEFWFKTRPDDPDWRPRLAIFGDMGNENAQSLSRLQEETQKGMYDAILHVGDFAYDMNSEEGVVGDEFMRQIESVAAYVPYMVCAGNHEEKYNFSHYRARFSMPSDSESLVYSFNMGPIHFIGFSTEVYYFLNYGVKQLVYQYKWLQNDLEKANRPENRRDQPWIIAFGHRPMYCSNDNADDCHRHDTYVRVGLPVTHFFGLEKLFYENGVDVYIGAHQHSYERLWPIYDYEVRNGSYEAPYTNPTGPVHIITGSAGCEELHSNFTYELPKWSAFRSEDYGYTKLKAYNGSHLHFEQISVDKLGQVIDDFWLIKDEHKSYP
uniref:Purple acid phosphatase n=1 Tax=Xenopsylla cheopis TaxID=163159 RepID=A0A6M2DZ18_XENCH